MFFILKNVKCLLYANLVAAGKMQVLLFNEGGKLYISRLHVVQLFFIVSNIKPPQ